MVVHRLDQSDDGSKSILEHLHIVKNRGPEEHSIVLLVSASNCGPCNRFVPLYEDLASKIDGVEFYDYKITNYQTQTPKEEKDLKGLTINGYPTVFVFIHGEKGIIVETSDLETMLLKHCQENMKDLKLMNQNIRYQCGCVMSGFHVLYFYDSKHGGCPGCDELKNIYPKCVFELVDIQTQKGRTLMEQHGVTTVPSTVVVHSHGLQPESQKICDCLERDLAKKVSHYTTLSDDFNKMQLHDRHHRPCDCSNCSEGMKVCYIRRSGHYWEEAKAYHQKALESYIFMKSGSEERISVPHGNNEYFIAVFS